VGSNTPYKKAMELGLRIGFEAMILPINGLIQVCLFVSIIYDLWLVKGQKNVGQKVTVSVPSIGPNVQYVILEIRDFGKVN
jgi:hypothetical protein